MPESTTITCPRLTSILFHSSPAQAVCATSLERADFKVQVILKTVDFWSRQLQGRGVQPAVLLFTRTNVKAVLQHLQCHKAVIRDRRLMPTGIGGFLVPCSEGWPGRVKFISVQKPRILSEHYWIPVPRLSVALQQCSGSWPALCTLGIAPKGAERQEAGGFITSFLLCVMATLFCSCAMRIAEVLHFFFIYYSRWDFLSSCPFTWGWKSSACKVWLSGLLWMFSRIKWHRLLKECLIFWKPTVFAMKTHPFFPNMAIQAGTQMGTQKPKLRAWSQKP